MGTNYHFMLNNEKILVKPFVKCTNMNISQKLPETEELTAINLVKLINQKFLKIIFHMLNIKTEEMCISVSNIQKINILDVFDEDTSVFYNNTIAYFKKINLNKCKIDHIKVHIQILKKIMPQKIIITNDNKLNDLINSLTNKLVEIDSKNSSINIVIQEISSIIDQITKIVDQNIAFFNELKKFSNQFLDIIQKFSINLRKFDEMQKSSEFKSYVIKSVLIDPNRDFIFELLYEKDSNADINYFNLYMNEIKESILKLISNSNEEKLIKENEIISIDDYLKQEMLSLIDSAQEMFGCAQNEEISIVQMNQLKGEFIFDYSSPNNIFSNIQFIITNQIQIKSSVIYDLFDSLSNFYDEYVGSIKIIQSYQKFINFYESNNYNSKQLSGPIKNKIIQIFDEIQQQGKYFLIDVLFQDVIDNLLDQNVFQLKINDRNKKVYFYDDNNSNKMHFCREEITYNDINSVFQVNFDQNMNFILCKIYNQSIEENEKEREKSIILNNYSKYIVHSDASIHEGLKNRLIFPYFPIGTLGNLFQNVSNNKARKAKKIKLSNVDKVIIIIEIAIALDDLHSNNEYHGSICDQIVYINSKKDAYMGSFCHNQELEIDATKTKGPFYYRSPEILSNDGDNQNIDDENYFNDQKSNDIYSFGVLMHEILTSTVPDSRMGNRSRKERINILKGDYCIFLFSGENNECFDEKSADSFGNNFSDFKEIIEKCLKIDKNERYSNMKEIINDIQKASIFILNKEEIEYRLSNSINSWSYQCTLSNIVESYYRGHEYCFEDIEKSLDAYQNVFLIENRIQITNDNIIKTIFNVFDIKYNEDFTSIFEDIFNHIIVRSVTNIMNQNSDLNDNLLLFSNYANMKQSISAIDYNAIKSDSMNCHNSNFIFPISSLEDFIKNNENMTMNLSPTWIYCLAKEIALIHSNNLYHGELSTKTIGIYYDNKTQTFIPSILLFYSFYKHISNYNQYESDSKLRKIKKLKCTKNQYFDSNENIISKFQAKDIKDLKKILEKIQNGILEYIEDSSSIDDILFILYNHIINNVNEEQKNIFNKNYLHNDFSSYQITFPILKNLFTKINYDNSFIDVESIIQTIIKFLENTINNIEKPIIYNIPLYDLKQQNNESISQQLSLVNSKCQKIIMTFPDIIPDYESVDLQNQSDKNKNYISKPIKHFQKLELISLYQSKKELRDKKIEILNKKEVFRYVEFKGLYRKSFKFLFTRYINNLNPSFKYRITVKLTNVKHLDIQDESITLSYIKQIINSICPYWKEPEAQDGNIIVYINIYKNR